MSSGYASDIISVVLISHVSRVCAVFYLSARKARDPSHIHGDIVVVRRDQLLYCQVVYIYAFSDQRGIYGAFVGAAGDGAFVIARDASGVAFSDHSPFKAAVFYPAEVFSRDAADIRKAFDRALHAAALYRPVVASGDAADLASGA